jgi:transglutaminase-like putative cysteine protease
MPTLLSPQRRRIAMAWLTGLFVFLCLQTPQLLHAQPVEKKADEKKNAGNDTWQVIYIGKGRVGYVHSTTSKLTRDNRTVYKTVSESNMTFKRFGQTIRMSTRTETEEIEDGRMISFSHETRNPPANTTRTVGKVNGKMLELAVTVAGRTNRKTLPWDPAVKSPAWQDRALREKPLKPRGVRTFKTFLPDFNKVTTVKIAADDYQVVKLYDGRSRKRLKVRITQSVLPTLTVRAFLDSAGETSKTETNLLGQPLITYTVPREVALQELAGGELDIAVNTLVRVAKPIRRGHRSRKVVYRITTPDVDASTIIKTGDTQSVKKVSDDTVELTVTALDIPARSRVKKTKSEYLASTQFLQSNDRLVIDHANRASAGESDPGKIAVRMEKHVHNKLSKKNFSTALASAAEVAKNLEGDCTEHAVLLAAMLRVKKIPSRIAVGMVYIEGRNVFGGHMWTEAYLDGKWIPLDATLGRGGIGAAHIKLAESNFAQDGPAPIAIFVPLLKVLGKMKVEVVSAE